MTPENRSSEKRGARSRGPIGSASRITPRSSGFKDSSYDEEASWRREVSGTLHNYFRKHGPFCIVPALLKVGGFAVALKVHKNLSG